MHGIGKGRKPGARNKSKVERLIDMIVTATDQEPSVTVDLLQEHWDVMKNRMDRGQDPVRSEFGDGNKVLDRYMRKTGLQEPGVRDTLKHVMQIVRKPPTVSDIDKS
jgi:hypothetical protein